MGEYAALQARIGRSTLPQSFAYAQAMSRTHGQVPRLGVIEQDGCPIGVVQILERRQLKIVTEHHMHRGPLWLDDKEPEPTVLKEVLCLLRKTCPSGLLHRTSILPEIAARPDVAAMMQECGFRKVGPGYRTLWLDLRQSPEELRAKIARNWRHPLKKAEKAEEQGDLLLDADWQASNLPWLIKKEIEQSQAKGFRGLTGATAVRLRNALLKGGRKDDGVLMLSALADRKSSASPMASGLFLRHGRCATYQLGWSDDRGRKLDAMRLVLWRAALELQERGVDWLDLGGINPDSAPGVTEFKRGLGGIETESIGLYR